MHKDVLKHWLAAVFVITCIWSSCNIVIGYASKILGANVIIFNCLLFLGASISLLLYSGAGKLGKETMRSGDTWGYGITLIMTYIIVFGIIGVSSATEGALLQSSGIIASIFASWLFFNRKIKLLQQLGTIFIIAGIFIICRDNTPDNRALIISLTIIFAILQAARTLFAESHKTHNYAMSSTDPKDKIRVVGYIMFIVSLLFLSLTFIFSLIQEMNNTKLVSFIPSLKEFTNPASIFFGLICGVIIMAPIRATEFLFASKLKAENYLALGALSPFATLFWEWATAPITHLSLKEFSSNDWIAGVLILAGGLTIAFSKAKSHINDDVNEYIEYSSDIGAIEDSKDILHQSLTYFNNDISKLAKELKISLDSIKAVLEKDNIALKKDVLRKIERVYRKDISVKDSLTGLFNRSGLLHNLEQMVEKNKSFTLFYIDLNKFKPINDTYGHQAGDEALMIIGERLQNYKGVKVASRLGGDEYVIIMEKIADAEVIIKELNKIIEDFFVIPSVNMVASISASIGYVKSADYKNYDAEKLLKIADTMMLSFKEKSER